MKNYDVTLSYTIAAYRPDGIRVLGRRITEIVTTVGVNEDDAILNAREQITDNHQPYEVVYSANATVAPVDYDYFANIG